MVAVAGMGVADRLVGGTAAALIRWRVTMSFARIAI
jgi:hypothetical protein